MTKSILTQYSKSGNFIGSTNDGRLSILAPNSIIQLSINRNDIIGAEK